MPEDPFQQAVARVKKALGKACPPEPSVVEDFVRAATPALILSSSLAEIRRVASCF